jgi:hypothetical protein
MDAIKSSDITELKSIRVLNENVSMVLYAVSLLLQIPLDGKSSKAQAD